jgi:hypothetical protein
MSESDQALERAGADWERDRREIGRREACRLYVARVARIRRVVREDQGMSVDDVLSVARDRGVDRGRADRAAGVYVDDPLSGEWAGESIPELLGDLLVGLFDDPSREDMDHDVWDTLCDAFESGYRSAFDDVLIHDLVVCPDCFGWLASLAGATESPAGECPAIIAGWDKPGVSFDLSAGSNFGWWCDTCETDLRGDRYDVRVWESLRG